VELRFLSPEAALVGLVVLVPLAGLAVSGERARRIRRVLTLPDPGHAASVAPAAAIVAAAGLLALAAAQPVLADERSSRFRRDVQAMFVIDVSRSMLAAPAGGRTRFERARARALALQSELEDVPVGIASLTDRLLPHLFPTIDADAFRGTLQRAVGPDRPPPASFWIRATSFEPLGDLVSRNFFSRRVTRRVIVVFTDGEARAANVPALVQALNQEEGVRLLFVRFWSPSERIHGPNGPEPEYRPDLKSSAALARLARPLSAEVVSEPELDGADEALRRAVGSGETARRTAERESLAIAPYAAVLVLVPLLFLLWTRNRA
jgi:von Willebrand factor type A domain